MLPYLLLIFVGVGISAFGMSYFPALQARKGYPFAGLGTLIALAGMVLSDNEGIFLLGMLMTLILAPALSFPIHDFRTRRRDKKR